MKRFWPYLEVDRIAVESWHAALAPEIPDAATLGEAVLRVFRGGNSRDLGARIVEEAHEILGVEAPSPYRNVTAELVDAAKNRALEAANVTESEYEANRHDAAWLHAHFPKEIDS